MNDLVNPWTPMTDPLDLKHLGKLGEEVCEAGSAIFRCVIQGIDEAEPVTKKVNRIWLQEEIADVEANLKLVKQHFALDEEFIRARVERKLANLQRWHNMEPVKVIA